MAVVYPYTKFKFRVEIEGITQAGFSEVSGSDVSLDVTEYREGNHPTNGNIKIPGLVKYGNVTLKYGISDDMSFFNWLSECAAGKITRKAVTIVLLDSEGQDKCTWTLENAWPTKYTAPDFNATASEVAVETVELVHEGMKRSK